MSDKNKFTEEHDALVCEIDVLRHNMRVVLEEFAFEMACRFEYQEAEILKTHSSILKMKKRVAEEEDVMRDFLKRLRLIYDREMREKKAQPSVKGINKNKNSQDFQKKAD